jgi:3',5'-cyclic AMP phosphodiesterase CpdA
MTQPFRLAHLSDLHFSEIDWNFSQFLSKKWVGNLNFLLRRRKDFDYSLLDSMPSLLKNKGVNLVLLSGDLSCTSSAEEFKKALVFIEKLKDEGLDVVVVPGNHDHYTKEAYRKKVFYDFFPSKYGRDKWDLNEHQIALKQLSDKWWLLLLDTTLATPLLCSYGKFTKNAENHLREALESLPEGSQVVLANHFPIRSKSFRKELQRQNELLTLLKEHPQIRFYLHGHNHHHTILDLRKEGLPVAVDTGSATIKTSGSWTLMECRDSSCSFEPFRWDMEKHAWVSNPKHTFNW